MVGSFVKRKQKAQKFFFLIQPQLKSICAIDQEENALNGLAQISFIQITIDINKKEKTMNKKQLFDIKEKLESKRIEKATKEGQLEAEKKKMKEEFGVTTPKEAKEKISSIDAELSELEEKYDNAVTSFKEKYSELIGV
jgi:Zn-dependent oligopeptidase